MKDRLTASFVTNLNLLTEESVLHHFEILKSSISMVTRHRLSILKGLILSCYTRSEIDPEKVLNYLQFLRCRSLSVGRSAEWALLWADLPVHISSGEFQSQLDLLGFP